MLNRLRDVFESLNEHEVRYLVIGGIAGLPHAVEADELVAVAEHGGGLGKRPLPEVLVEDIPTVSGEVVDVPSETGLVAPGRQGGFWSRVLGCLTGSR